MDFHAELSSDMEQAPSASSAPRRQGRIRPHTVILPQGIDPVRWYDITSGRRHDDHRPGMVLLDFGQRRMHLPESCLEFRDANSAAPARTAAARRSQPGVPLLRRVTSRHLAMAATVFPVGLAVVVAAKFALGNR